MKLFLGSLSSNTEKPEYIDEWDAKKWNSYGDSITAQSQWQPTVNAYFNMTYYRLGVGGSSVAGDYVDSYWQDARVDTLADTLEFVFILGGANDFSRSIPLGDINSVDTNEFCGALNVMLEKIMLVAGGIWNANKIVLITPYYNERNFVPDPGINLIGLGVSDYAEAVRQIASKYSITCADAFNDMGLDASNLRTYAPDGVHVNAEGGQLLADSVIKAMKTLNPNL